MGCYYCNAWANHALGDKQVCEDCFQTIKAVQDEDRVGVLTTRLQKIHGMLLQQPQHGYVANWCAELAKRLEFLSQVEGASTVVPPGTCVEYNKVLIPAPPEAASEPVKIVKTAKPKKLVIKKFR